MEQNLANLKDLIAEYHDIILCYYDYWSHVKPIVAARKQATNLLESYRRDKVPDAKRIAELEKKLKELAIEDNKVHEELKGLVGQYEQGRQRLPRLLKEMDRTTGSRMPSFRFYDQEKRPLEYDLIIIDSVANRNHSRKDRGSLIENLMEQQEEYFKKIGKANPARLTQPGQGETPGTGGGNELGWEFDSEKHEVKRNGSNPVELEPRLFNLFEYLHRKKQATLERIEKDLEIKGSYKHLIVNRISKLISILDKEAKVLGLKEGEIKRIIERKRDGRRLVRVIFHAS